MERRAIQLNKIVDRLLLSSRIESGRAEVQCSAVDAHPLLKDRVQALAATTGREIHLAVDDSLPQVHADPDALATIVDHLLDNAVKYSPEGGPITVEGRAGGDGVAISVADPGIGMDPEQAAHCFDKFWQAESSDVRRFGGTGIGLFIVRSLVEGMGGKVAVESALGKGTTFCVQLLEAGRARTEPLPAQPAADRGEQSMIREFMRQIGIPQSAQGRKR